MTLKKCGKCGKTKDINKFHKNKSRKDGHDTWCADCSNKYNKSYYLENSDKKREASRIRSAKHYARAKKCYKTYFNMIVSKHCYNISGKYLAELYENSPYCYYCGRGFASHVEAQIEHKTPVSRGGKSTKDNIVFSCAACNRLKWDMTEEEFKEFLATYVIAVATKISTVDRGQA